ncbi:MAG: hypothetical protein QME96_10215 [Myxococcota bacterium]|nr:hypothetical protein [Myxococcota bacterium]
MAATPFEERLLADIVEAARAVGLEIVLVGNAAAALQGAPVATRDVDFLVRAGAANRRKIERLAERLGGLAVTRPGEPLSDMLRLVGGSVEIDFVFRLSSGARFESVRSRACTVRVGRTAVRVASLADIIAAKRAARRPKDLAALPVLEQTARVLAAIGGKHRRPGGRR